MLKPEDFDGAADRMVEIYSRLENFILRDTARRVLNAGKLTATADRLIYKLEQFGESRQEIQKKLSELTGLSEKELRRLLQDAVLTSWKDDAQVMSQIGIEISTPLENKAYMRIIDAEYRKSLGELSNLTRTTMDAAQRDLINLLDDAEMRVSSGVQSYNAAAADVLDAYAGRGIMVTYPSGTRRTLEAAARCCVVTSMNQTAAQLTNQYIVEGGIEYILTSAHIGARTRQPGQPALAGHDSWQGRVYKIRGSEPDAPNLLESTGYDIDPQTGNGAVVNPLGLHGYNCRHSHQPWDKRLRNPWRDEKGNLIDGTGSEITDAENRERYKNSQKQRAMERAIRKTKRQLIVKQEEINASSGEYRDTLQAEYDAEAYRLIRQNKAYNEFCKEHNLQPQYDRNKLAGFGTTQAKAANNGARRYQNAKGD
ncbi:MAG TPA: phage minor capsid protein [Candidatus Mediterraneibacter cottocaccae]|nr:phage minor capsid protein [Candidatus Mediterraneibacter cottocaccae]